MSQLLLPLVELLVTSYDGPSLENVKIIGVQHILETTHSMFQSLYQRGLKPENVSIIGKCYSTCEEVYNEMVQEGIDVGRGSFSYSSHLPYDDQFTAEVESFLNSRITNLDDYDCVIVLDDGGKCITALNKLNLYLPSCVAIEQTSSGYEAIRSQNLPFPVINVARSPLKLRLESPMIAHAAAERLYLSLKEKDLSPEKALIIGGGAIGQAMREKLAPDMEVSIIDQNKSLSDYEFHELPDLIHSFPLIIGCTGKTSILHSLHPFLSPKTTLVSASSSDREFDSVYLRRKLPINTSCHSDLVVGNILLVNSGFPVNFDGDRENIEPELIQLTIALITAGILQARTYPANASKSIHPLCQDYEKQIEDNFLTANRI